MPTYLGASHDELGPGVKDVWRIEVRNVVKWLYDL